MRSRIALINAASFTVVVLTMLVGAFVLRTPERAKPAARSAQGEGGAQPPAAVAATIPAEFSALLAANPPADSAAAQSLPEVSAEALRMEPWRRQYYCHADFNKDDAIDRADLLLYIHTLQTRTGPAAEWLDINNDGVIDQRDTIEFLNAFFRGDCNPQERRTLRSCIC